MSSDRVVQIWLPCGIGEECAARARKSRRGIETDEENRMEPFEWLLLGVGLVVGSLLGSRGKDVVRSTAKGYMSVSEKTTQLVANAREDLRDAIEEARYEHENETKSREEQPDPPALVEAKPA